MCVCPQEIHSYTCRMVCVGKIQIIPKHLNHCQVLNSFAFINSPLHVSLWLVDISRAAAFNVHPFCFLVGLRPSGFLFLLHSVAKPSLQHSEVVFVNLFSSSLCATELQCCSSAGSHMTLVSTWLLLLSLLFYAISLFWPWCAAASRWKTRRFWFWSCVWISVCTLLGWHSGT